MTVARPETTEAEYARRFAREHAHYVEDLPFWRALAARIGSPVLDVGAASGRVALDLARAGNRVCAVDPSEEMRAEIARALAEEPADVARRVQVRAGRLETLDLGCRYPLVIVAMNTMQVLTRPTARRDAMRALARHVAPGGALALDVARVQAEEVRAAVGLESESARYLTDDGATVRQWSWFEGIDAGTMTARFAIRVLDERAGAEPEVRVRRHVVHVYPPEEIPLLAAGAGMEVREAYGDFRGGPAHPGAERQVYVLGHSGAST